jgi:tetratricopeptide (TPR) repeat protein
MIIRRLMAILAVTAASAGAQAQQAGGFQLSPERRAADSLLIAKQYAAAIVAFERLTTTEAGRPGHWMQLGFAAYGAGQFEKAGDAFARSNALARNGIARYNAAAMYAKAGKVDAALAWVDSAVALNAMVPEQVAKDSDFDRIRPDARFVAAMERAQKALTPCMSNLDYHRLDFWIGDWDVRTTAGGLAGQSRVERIAGGCALLENWEPGPGRPGGKSINTWNPQQKQLQQYWVGGGGGVTEYRKGTWTDTSVVYLAEGADQKGQKLIQRLTFAAQRDGRVRQWAEVSVNDAAFTTQYDFYYSRRK